jgi:zinc transport system substrate-binding protein
MRNPFSHAPRTAIAFAALLGAGSGAGCDPDGGQQAARPAGATVVATLHPVASLVRALVPDSIRVVTLLPPGAHPDTWEPTPRLAETVSAAALVVRVGGAADQWLGEVSGTRELVLADHVRLLDGSGPGTGNPHVWLDPILVRDALLPPLAEALRGVAGVSAGLDDRAAALADSLGSLDREIRALLEDAPVRRFVAAHAAWVYFAHRYGLEQVGVLHGSPGNEPGSRELARLVDDARGRGIGAVIAEPQLGRAGVEAVAGELDVAVEVADPVGGEGLEGRGDYFALMRFNARAFARALGAGS